VGSRVKIFSLPARPGTGKTALPSKLVSLWGCVWAKIAKNPGGAPGPFWPFICAMPKNFFFPQGGGAGKRGGPCVLGGPLGGGFLF